MSGDIAVNRPLFGGAITATFPLRFKDLSDIRQVPDHQEAYCDPSRDESLIFELLDLKTDVADQGSATWFLQDLAGEQNATEGLTVFEQSNVFEANGLHINDVPSVVSTAVAHMGISKDRQGREAKNIVKVYLANIRLKGARTDVLITAYEPLMINPLSASAASVGAGVAAPAEQSGLVPMSEVFKLAATSFKVNNWGLFGV